MMMPQQLAAQAVLDQQPMPNLLALDQASDVTGYAIYDIDDHRLIAYGHFSLGTGDLGKRLVSFRTKIQDLISQYSINQVAFEDIQLQANVGNNAHTFKTLAEIYGVLHELCVELDLPYDVILAGTWKSTLGIKGKARAEQKRNAQAWVQNTFNVKPIQDECDAICIGAHTIAQIDKSK